MAELDISNPVHFPSEPAVNIHLLSSYMRTRFGTWSNLTYEVYVLYNP